MDFAAFQDSGGHPQIFVTAARTRAEEGIGNFRTFDIFNIMYQMPVGRDHYLRFDFGTVILVGFNIFGVFIAVLRFEFYLCTSFEKVDDLLAGVHNTGFGAGEHCQAAHRLASVHAHAIHYRSGEFHHLVNRAVRADLSQNVLIDISAHDTVL